MPRFCAGFADPSGGESAPCIFAKDGSGKPARVKPPRDRCELCDFEGLGKVLRSDRRKRKIADVLDKWEASCSPVLKHVFVASALSIVGPEFFAKKKKKMTRFKQRFQKQLYRDQLRKEMAQPWTPSYPILYERFPKERVANWRGWYLPSGLHLSFQNLLRIGLHKTPVWEVDGIKAVKEGLITEKLPPEFIRRRQLIFRSWYWSFSERCRFCKGELRGAGVGYCPKRSCKRRRDKKLQALHAQRQKLERWMIRKHMKIRGLSTEAKSLESNLHKIRYGWHLGIVGILRDHTFRRMYGCFQHVLTCPESQFYNFAQIRPLHDLQRSIHHQRVWMCHMPLFHGPIPLGFYFLVKEPEIYAHCERPRDKDGDIEAIRDWQIGQPGLHHDVCCSQISLTWRFTLERFWLSGYPKSLLQSDTWGPFFKDSRRRQWEINFHVAGDFLVDARPLAAERPDCVEWPRPELDRERMAYHRSCQNLANRQRRKPQPASRCVGPFGLCPPV
ncbi:unnamed protein product [Symbiodinium sp. CCMP2592]|nr:unnamed protein product [Symbiodinium sp. CCMP2592]